jgi:hypothetical protein
MVREPGQPGWKILSAASQRLPASSRCLWSLWAESGGWHRVDLLLCARLLLSLAMAMPESDQPSSQEPQTLPEPLRQALVALVSRAPHPLFPKARRLYFDKYPLEGHPDALEAAAAPPPLRTFLLQETLIEADGSVVAPPLAEPVSESLFDRFRLQELAVVHWQAETIDLHQVHAYLQQAWQLEGATVTAEPDGWFREGGAWARVSLSGADPVPAPAAPEASP